jgi:hypothetical protein
LAELLTFLNGAVSERDVDLARTVVFPNVGAPLFLNTVGAWTYRPNTKTRLENLYVAGDWCRTGVDLTTMEGAISSGLATAGHVLRAFGSSETVEPIEIPAWPERWLRVVAWIGLPGVLALKAALWLRGRFMGEASSRGGRAERHLGSHARKLREASPARRTDSAPRKPRT